MKTETEPFLSSAGGAADRFPPNSIANLGVGSPDNFICKSNR